MTFYIDAAITTNFTTDFTTNETCKRIVSIVPANPNVTAKLIAAELNITGRNVKNYIKSLKTAGIIGRVGATKNGHWIVK